ncbi:hypothetical protein Tco_1347966, partial [Tanacetum coccineum]
MPSAQSSKPPVSGGQRQSTVANHQSTTMSHRQTTIAPPPHHRPTTSQLSVNHPRSTMVNGPGLDRVRPGSHVALPEWATCPEVILLQLRLSWESNSRPRGREFNSTNITSCAGVAIPGSENRPPMLNKENYVPWSSRLLRYAKSRPNGKLIYNSIMNGPYVRRMIPEPGDA